MERKLYVVGGQGMGIEPISNQKGECKLGKEITSNQKEEEFLSNEMDERKFIHNQ
jgi:hypothetical protein